MKEIRIPTEESEIFSKYLAIINLFLSKAKRLTDQEIDVLGKMLYINNKYINLDKEQRDIILFNKLTKEKIRINLKDETSIPSFENCISKLRAKGYIDGKSLLMSCPGIINGKIEIDIKLEIQNETNKS